MAGLSHAVRSSAEVLQDGEDAAVVLSRRRQPQLGEDAGDMSLDRRNGDDQRLSDPVIGPAFGHPVKNLTLAGTEGLDRALVAPAADEPGDDGGIQDGSPCGHPAYRLGEALDVADAVLEQV